LGADAHGACGLEFRYHRVNPWLRKKVAMDDPSVIPQLVALAQRLVTISVVALAR
jgi:hypothetical protein